MGKHRNLPLTHFFIRFLWSSSLFILFHSLLWREMYSESVFHTTTQNNYTKLLRTIILDFLQLMKRVFHDNKNTLSFEKSSLSYCYGTFSAINNIFGLCRACTVVPYYLILFVLPCSSMLRWVLIALLFICFSLGENGT